MLFQLLGQPNLNQKAREVAPFASSLTTTGLFVLITRGRVFLWIGYDYFNWYVEDEDAEDWQNFISEELMTKLVFTYENCQKLDPNSEDDKAKIDLSDVAILMRVQGQEGDDWNDYIEGTKIFQDDELIGNRKVQRGFKQSVTLRGTSRQRTINYMQNFSQGLHDDISSEESGSSDDED